jgi:hypothetical protein
MRQQAAVADGAKEGERACLAQLEAHGRAAVHHDRPQARLRAASEQVSVREKLKAKAESSSDARAW